jgi:DnaJ-class molecular chaperone
MGYPTIRSTGTCPECQGSCYVPGPMYEERMVDECPKCGGTGKDAKKKAA